MNKEVKELIDTIKQLLSEYSPKSDAFTLEDYDVEYNQLKGLVDYINQIEEENKQFRQANVEFVSQNNKLQHRIYEAIDYIKHSWWLRTGQTYDTSKDLKDWEAEEILSILEGGKE